MFCFVIFIPNKERELFTENKQMSLKKAQMQQQG